MRAVLLPLTLLALLAVPARAQPQTQLQISENTYNVFRNGKHIGSHIIKFEKSGYDLTVETTTDMKVKLLFVTAFSYDYLSTEKWSGTSLISAKTNGFI
jgi:hypothetical protein